MKNYELQVLLKEIPDDYEVILDCRYQEVEWVNVSIVGVDKSVQHGKIVLDVNKTLTAE